MKHGWPVVYLTTKLEAHVAFIPFKRRRQLKTIKNYKHNI